MAHGIRAIAILLMGYEAHKGANTIRKLINIWAPPNENPTAAYIAFVSVRVGVGADEIINLSKNSDTLTKLVWAIIQEEDTSGMAAKYITANDLASGIQMAYRI